MVQSKKYYFKNSEQAKQEKYSQQKLYKYKRYGGESKHGHRAQKVTLMAINVPSNHDFL